MPAKPRGKEMEKVLPTVLVKGWLDIGGVERWDGISWWCGLNVQCLHQDHAFELDSYTVILFGKAVEPLGGGASLEEGSHRNMV